MDLTLKPDLSLDGRVVAISPSLVLVTGALVGLASTPHATRGRVARASREAARAVGWARPEIVDQRRSFAYDRRNLRPLSSVLACPSSRGSHFAAS